MPSRPSRQRPNAEWHEAHRMPRTARLEERVEWHIAHTQECGCREAPPTIVAAIKQRRSWTQPADDPKPPRQTSIPPDGQHDGRPPHMNPSRPG